MVILDENNTNKYQFQKQWGNILVFQWCSLVNFPLTENMNINEAHNHHPEDYLLSSIWD